MNLFFDLDGTISDPFEGITRSINAALNRCGGEELPLEKLARFIGPPLTDTFASLLETHHDALIAKAISFYRERYVTEGFQENELYSGITEQLSKLQRRGYRLFIVTSKRKDIADSVIEHFSLQNYFEHVYGCGINLSKSDLIKKILSERNIETNDALMIGDRNFDIEAGKANGIKTLGVLWGYGDSKELVDAGADLIIEKVLDLSSVIIELTTGKQTSPETTPKPKLKSLARSADKLAPLMAKGGIVTAEYVQGVLSFHSTGEIGVEGVAPENILFEIGSITKVFTGLLLAVAITEGKVTLETNVSDILPKITFDDPRIGEVTLKQLVTHCSGLNRDPEITENLLIYDSDPDALYDRDDFFSDLSRMQLKGDRHYEYDYSNTGFGLLGELLAIVYDQSWEELIAEKITQPLGLLDTVATLSDEQKQRQAPGYSDRARMPNMKVDAIAGCGALSSTASDLIHFGKSLLDPQSSPLAKEIELLLQMHDEKSQTGLGISLAPFQGHQAYAHDGCTSGYNACIFVLPETSEIHVAMANNFSMVVWAIISEMYGQETRYTLTYRSLENEKLEEFTGVYTADESFGFWSGNWRIFIHDSQLWGQFKCHGLFKLGATQKEDQFSSRFTTGPFYFSRDDKGNVISLTVGIEEAPLALGMKVNKSLPKFKFLGTEKLDEYVGNYENENHDKLVILSFYKTLYLIRLGTDDATGDFVYATGKDQFEYLDTSASIEFERNDAGLITILKLKDADLHCCDFSRIK